MEEKLPISKVIVFGSQARGKRGKRSDIDVCIISPKFKDSFSALTFLWQRRTDEEVMAGLEPVGFSEKEFKKGSSFLKEVSETEIEI